MVKTGTWWQIHYICSWAGWAPLIGFNTARIFRFRFCHSIQESESNGKSYNVKLAQEWISARFQSALPTLGCAFSQNIVFFLRFLVVEVKRWPQSRSTCHHSGGSKTIYDRDHEAVIEARRLGFPQNLKLLGRSWAHWYVHSDRHWKDVQGMDQLDQCFKLFELQCTWWHKLSSVILFESWVLQVLPGPSDSKGASWDTLACPWKTHGNS